MTKKKTKSLVKFQALTIVKFPEMGVLNMDNISIVFRSNKKRCSDRVSRKQIKI